MLKQIFVYICSNYIKRFELYPAKYVKATVQIFL